MTQPSHTATAEPETGRSFTTAAQLQESVAAIRTTTDRAWRLKPGPRYLLEFSPGTVKITARDYARSSHAENARIASHLRKDADMLLEELQSPSKRGDITDWSGKSRARMAYRLATLDYAKLFEMGERAAMVTLTMPMEWQRLAPSGDHFKALVNSFRKRYWSAWGHDMRGVWKMEFQRRGAPHLHIVTVPPAGLAVGLRLPFEEWLSNTWADLVFTEIVEVRPATKTKRAVNERRPREAPAPWSEAGWAQERMKHTWAGTGVDYDEVANYSDPKRIGVYFAKHGSYFDKEYQNEAPALWKLQEGTGVRFWGYWVVRPALATKETHESLIMHIMSSNAIPGVGNT